MRIILLTLLLLFTSQQGVCAQKIINYDIDYDGDGVPYRDDAFPYDSTETTDTDRDGIGNNADTDDDGDGVADTKDAFPLDKMESVDTDGDGIGNNADLDDDGDGVPDTRDAFPLDKTESVDTDGDGKGNNADTDDDGDGIPDTEDAFPLDKTESIDTDDDGIGDNSDPEDDRENANIIHFVERFYQEVLGRTADTAGLNDWVSQLVDGTKSGADIAKGFIFSQEFTNQANGNEAFLHILYKAFFNRAADNGGFTAWLDKLNQGTSREDVLNGFLYSTEFKNLSESYGIKAVPDTPATLIENFVKRFYSEVLGRTADAGGLADWVNRLQSKTSTGSDIATGFVFSDEFKDRHTDDVTFLEILYKAFFGREFDEGGLNGWLNQLEQGITREDVLNGFLYSTEFVNLCDKYGIIAYHINLNASQGAPRIYGLHSIYVSRGDLATKAIKDVITINDYTINVGTGSVFLHAPITGDIIKLYHIYGRVTGLYIDNHEIHYDANGDISSIYGERDPSLSPGTSTPPLYQSYTAKEISTSSGQLNKILSQDIYSGINILDTELARLISFLEARKDNNGLNNFLTRGVIRHALGVTNYITSHINSNTQIITIETGQFITYTSLDRIGNDLRNFYEIANSIPQILDYDLFGETPTYPTGLLTDTVTTNTTNTSGGTYSTAEISATATEFTPSYSREDNIVNAGILAETIADGQCISGGGTPGTPRFETIECISSEFGGTLYYCQVRATIACTYKNKVKR